MSIFGNIMSKIFGHASATTSTSGTVPTQGSASTPDAAPSGDPPPASSPAGASASAGAKQNVDVGAVLDGLAAKNAQKLDWRHSIVDMISFWTWVRAFQPGRNLQANFITRATRTTPLP